MSVSSHPSISSLLKSAGYPKFPLDDYGFPQPGVVIRYFRERMTYIDPEDQKEKHWRQIDLAERLGVSEVTIRLMETKNNSLDSIERRRVLADILRIPPVLLGIGSLTDLEEFLKQSQGQTMPATTISAPVTLKGTALEKETVKLYQDAFAIYSEKHSTSTARDAIFEMVRWIERIESDLPRAQNSQQSDLQEVLWNFHILSAKVYGDSLCDWDQALLHSSTAMELANLLNSDTLRALSLYRTGYIRIGQEKFYLAKSNLDNAVMYVKNANAAIKGTVLAAAGVVHAIVDTDLAGRKYAQNLLEQAGNLVVSEDSSDTYAIKYHTGKYLTEKAEALIALGRSAKAIEVLDDAEEGTKPSEIRRIAYIDILRAEAHMKLKNPQYDTATQLLRGAFVSSSSIRSAYNIDYISRLYADLGKSSYGNSTNVSDLGLMLRNWRKGR